MKFILSTLAIILTIWGHTAHAQTADETKAWIINHVSEKAGKSNNKYAKDYTVSFPDDCTIKFRYTYPNEPDFRGNIYYEFGNFCKTERIYNNEDRTTLKFSNWIEECAKRNGKPLKCERDREYRTDYLSIRFPGFENYAVRLVNALQHLQALENEERNRRTAKQPDEPF